MVSVIIDIPQKNFKFLRSNGWNRWLLSTEDEWMQMSVIADDIA